MNTTRDQLVRGTAHKLIGVLIKSASPVLTIVLAHFFARDVFGQYVSLQLLALTLSRLCLLGLDKGMAWYLPQNARKLRPPAHQLGEAFLTALVTGAIVTAIAVLLFLFTPWSAGSEKTLGISPAFSALCLASILPLVAVNFLGPALEGIFQPKYRVWFGEFLLYAAVPPIAIALSRLGAGDLALPAAFLASASLCAILLLRAASRHFGSGAVRPRGRIDRARLAYSWPQGVSDFIASLLLRVDLWMILYLLGPESAAVYAIMLTLSNGVKTIRQNFDSLLLPVISGMDGETRARMLRPAFGFTVGIVTIIQYFIALAVFFFPREILSVAGREYALEPLALLVLLAGNLVNGFFGLNAWVLAGMGASGVLLRLNLATLALNVLLNLWLIPRHGLVGAASATVMALLVQHALLYFLQVRRSGQRLYSGPLWIQFALILAFGACAFLLYPVVGGAGIGSRLAGFSVLALAYGGFAWYLRKRTRMRRDS